MEEGISIDYKSLKKIVDNSGKIKSDGLRDLLLPVWLLLICMVEKL